MAKFKESDTFEIKIFVGLKDLYTGKTFPYEVVEQEILEYVKIHKMCITLTKTRFIYVNGSENGVIVGLINYPRFPKSRPSLETKALNLSLFLKDRFKQKRLSVMCPDKTRMLYTQGDE